jgi:galactokinase
MTGGGFGGCTVNLVRRELVKIFRTFVEEKYEQETGIPPPTYVVEADLVHTTVLSISLPD